MNEEQFLSGGGQMGALIRSMDWSNTALGPTNQWPQSLKTSVSLCLSSTFPILIAWGPELIQIYNDSYRPICGAKHPQSMGQNFKICWETALPVVGDAFDRGLAGTGTYIKDQQMLLDRNGYLEEAFMTFSFAPIRDESGNVGGIFHPITETTDQILSSRRTQVLRDLAIQTGHAKTTDAIYEKLREVQPMFDLDVPFLQVYEVDDHTRLATLKTSSGINDSILDFSAIKPDDEGTGWPFTASGGENNEPAEVSGLAERFGAFQSGPFELSPHTALIFPVVITGSSRPNCYLVVGVSSARSLDKEYRNFFELFANTVSTAFSNVDAYQQQQRRAQQLAEIDQAKTAFFSNISHEFRTPLTLILGPLQQMMEQPGHSGILSLENRDLMYRNIQRLLKLVNNLLDFSRLEAGRVKASFQQVQLGPLTADLASNFRSVIESAGMELILSIEQEDIPVYVDRDMWEKIVLNLLSNAFKYTLKGTITVRLTNEAGFAVLQVTDTGVGIQQAELPHMFERFHRIENSAGRTHEGTGIGLSLVAELVNLHHGAISVASVYGKGSTFTVRIPLGMEHLPQEQIIVPATQPATFSQQQTFIREAMSLLDRDQAGHLQTVLSQKENPQQDQNVKMQQHFRVLIADDNTDMRLYLEKLLSPYFSVELAVNGLDALDKIAQAEPDLIVSDVMMPGMNGQQLLYQLRQRPGSRIPVILLSARAGEESRMEGLNWGADDYLVKPFSAKELLSKINSVVRINQVTKKTETELRTIFQQAPVAIGIFRGPQLIIEVANMMMLRYWGKSGSQVIGLSLAQAFEKNDDNGLERIATQVFEIGERQMLNDWPLETLREGKISKLFVNLVVEPLRDITGVITGVMLVANDVTELITALELVRESEQRFRILANTMPQMIWRINNSDKQNFYNDYIYKYVGLTKEEILDNGFTLFVHPGDQEETRNAWQHATESNEDFTLEHRFRRYDGVYRWHLSRSTVQRDASGNIEGWMGASTDIHDQKMLEEILESRVMERTAELKMINERLVNSNQELEQFAYVTSHDLQEPLRKIQIFSKMVQIKMADADESILNYLNRITASAARMSQLIQDLLSFAGIISTGATTETVDLNEILKQVKEDFDYLIEEKQATILSDVLPVVQAIPLQMSQLFNNLLGNALKFSIEKPEIKILYKLVEADEQTDLPLKPQLPYARITITDNGIGFDQQLTDRIFTIFQRLHPQKEFAGTGIGLAICKRIVENHSGFISARSQKGIGSSFEVFLPIHRF
ncbi:ATP-binding protein [Dyadobacter sediminis]|nr:ATP-binding protein [Dyadobacter sediminis]